LIWEEQMKLLRSVLAQKPVVAAAVRILAVAATAAMAGQTSIAVAANVTDAAKEIGTAFTQQTGHRAIFSFGSSGQLYTQITQHAPFEVFLSADEERATQAISDGFAVADSRFTFAIGKIVLWSKNPQLVTGQDTLERPSFSKIAIANPAAAPYGLAAMEAMKALHVYDALRPKIVQNSSFV
jgi:molybdate transport system substrate-binding protein